MPPKATSPSSATEGAPPSMPGRRRDALRLLAEYNLYDAISLKAVLEHCEARLWARAGFDPGPRPAHGFERGDVLYDISRLVLDL